MARKTDWGFPMDTTLLIVIMSIVALHVAALAGGGLALGIMRLLGYRPASANEGEARESIH
jgi:hypothetical protein